MSGVATAAQDQASLTPDLALEELGWLLRPAGGGIHTVSTGRAAQQQLQARLYGVTGAAAVKQRWQADLARLSAARVVILGIPSDKARAWCAGPASARRPCAWDSSRRTRRC